MYSVRTTAVSVLSAVHPRNGSTAFTCAPSDGKKSLTPTRTPTRCSGWVRTRRVDKSRR